jgi:hypothetical protein
LVRFTELLRKLTELLGTLTEPLADIPDLLARPPSGPAKQDGDRARSAEPEAPGCARKSGIS